MEKFMKKFIAVFSMLFLLVSSAMALPGLGNYGNAVVGARNHGRQQDSTNNLKQIGVAIAMYGMDKNDAFPDSFTDCLSYLGNNSRIFIAGGDRVSKPARSGAPIKKENTSYAYLGKGLSLRAAGNASKTPIAFEKPQYFSKNQPLAVLYADGHVAHVKVPASERRNSVAVARFLCKNADKNVKSTLLKNAASAD